MPDAQRDPEQLNQVMPMFVGLEPAILTVFEPVDFQLPVPTTKIA